MKEKAGNSLIVLSATPSTGCRSMTREAFHPMPGQNPVWPRNSSVTTARVIARFPATTPTTTDATAARSARRGPAPSIDARS